MIRKKKWVALVHGQHWTVAKVSRHGNKLKIHGLFEYRGEGLAPEGMNMVTEQEEVLGQTQAGQGAALGLRGLKQWAAKERIPLKKLNYALSCPGVITRMITLPVLSYKDLEKLLTEQVDQYFTLNIFDYLVDYRILERIKEEDQERLRVLLVAIPFSEWSKQWQIWEQLGVTPKVTDFAADSLCRLYSRLSKWEENKRQASARDLAVVDLGADRVEFVLLEHGVLFLYSDMGISLDGLNEQDEAKERTEGVDGADRVYQSELEDNLVPVFNALSEFLNFFASRHYGKTADQIFITGECADFPGLEEIFERNMGIQAKVGFPGDWMPVFNKKSRHLVNQGIKYGSLYGLAFRED
ncbi:type IV pilus assembly protein PilM [Desulfitobacterium sp. LBE]|uniref:pilus assembly protein PilM n=1 Tax=Desulfitobacterium sp. LBE TaxID=884086 RepID=UPI001199CB3D|nr:pilus assembly protein PilM [Desulfitobacterium sp. LBE]TWH60643.1 type IV pilus assembly protein PilM [Desulfitobacterium sp. LBE]